MARIANKKEPAARRPVPRRPARRTKRTARKTPPARKVIALFPEAAFGPALNSVGIGQALEKLGHKVVFLSDPGFLDVYKGYGFEAHPVNLSEPLPPEEMAKFWVDFINGHIPNFRKSPYEQIDNYVRDCWSMIVETAKWAEKDLPGVLASVRPDVVCVDNVILFPAIKRYSREHGKPWIRIISCSENEIEDPDIPPHLSGCGAGDRRGHARYRRRFKEVIAPIHASFNEFLDSVGEKRYPLGQFFEASPHMNLLIYPSAVKFKRRRRLPLSRFQYLEGCVRKEAPYTVPQFRAHEDEPLLYVSFGSLGAGDTALLKRLIAALGRMPVRALVNVGDYLDQYTDVPPNVIVDRWFPQPSVIPQVDAVIHHGGNNSFTECLYFGKPALILPYVWDGHDNATRVQETGHGFKLDRYTWTDDELRDRITRMLTDRGMKARLKRTSRTMRSRHGPTKAARVIDAVARRRPARRAA
jgi:MGT family glycosyltransferase